MLCYPLFIGFTLGVLLCSSAIRAHKRNTDTQTHPLHETLFTHIEFPILCAESVLEPLCANLKGAASQRPASPPPPALPAVRAPGATIPQNSADAATLPLPASRPAYAPHPQRAQPPPADASPTASPLHLVQEEAAPPPPMSRPNYAPRKNTVGETSNVQPDVRPASPAPQVSLASPCLCLNHTTTGTQAAAPAFAHRSLLYRRRANLTPRRSFTAVSCAGRCRSAAPRVATELYTARRADRSASAFSAVSCAGFSAAGRDRR